MLRMYICMYVCMHVCMYICMYVYTYVFIDVCIYACMCVCIYVCVHVFICASVCLCMYVFVYMCGFQELGRRSFEWYLTLIIFPYNILRNASHIVVDFIYFSSNVDHFFLVNRVEHKKLNPN